MKKIGLIIVFVLVTLVGAYAQKKVSRSYINAGAISSTGAVTHGSDAIWIDFYNGYIKAIGCIRFDYSHRNSNGEYVYINPDKTTEKYIISSDYSEVWHMYEYTWFGNAVKNQVHYKFLGKGSQPAIDYTNGNL